MLKQWQEDPFFDVQDILALTLQATYKTKLGNKMEDFTKVIIKSFKKSKCVKTREWMWIWL